MSQAPPPRQQGTPCWVSLSTREPDAAEAFYGGLFGWTFAPGPKEVGDYRVALRDGKRVAGLAAVTGARRVPVVWTTYLAADSADEIAERIRECGGTVAVGPLDAGPHARTVLAADPQGSMLGVWEAHRMIGADVLGEPGSVVWSELVTRKTSDVLWFYERVFDLHAEPVPEEADHVHLVPPGGDTPVAGVHGSAEDFPDDGAPFWMVHFGTADTDASVHRAVELGGRVRTAPHDTPYGRRATVVDPAGVPFALIAR
ncbi:VOC family protein [Allostreptomyces psammosilenae]|uniref:VOC domain-containing protein n=1 Tax=Allostreptomyces psammosilenae TaxID=1892865 RepID=A0A852ZPE3_9ACTN|nr:VOC family protein [Allostreptomyces psammosilenae]NYI03130.1 hypothetical protein [Allostreptomyces psammosilenae]